MRPDPAFELAAACVVWPPSDAADAAVREAAARISDWNAFLSIVARHRIAGLARHALVRSGAGVPAELGARLTRRADNGARRDGLMVLETARLQRLLDRAGVPNLVLKGATLNALAYGRPGLKHSLDIDLLTTPDSVRDACAVLSAAGYVRASPSADLPDAQLDVFVALTREAAFHRKADNLLVELQWRVDLNSTWLTGVDAGSPSQLAQMNDGPPLRTLGPDTLYAYLCAHGARHGFSRLKWLADVAALLARASADEIETLHARASALGVERASGLTLRLCQRLLKLPLPEALSDRLKQDRALGPMVALCMDFLTGGGAAEAETRPLYLYRLAMLQLLLNGRRDQLAAEIRLRWASPRDHITLPLPPWAGFLYPLLRLPLFLVRRLRALRPS